MTIFQILILIFVGFVIYNALRRFFKKDISFWLMTFWVGLWILVGIIAVFPVIIEYTATLVGVGRGVDLLIYLALMVCFYNLFKISTKQKKLEKNIVDLVRKNAIDKAESKK